MVIMLIMVKRVVVHGRRCRCRASIVTNARARARRPPGWPKKKRSTDDDDDDGKDDDGGDDDDDVG